MLYAKMARVHNVWLESDEREEILERESTWNESETVTRRKHCCVLWMTAGGRKGIGTALRATPCELLVCREREGDWKSKSARAKARERERGTNRGETG